MQQFFLTSVGIVTILCAAFLLVGKINGKKLDQVNGSIVAEYGTTTKSLVVIGYCIISIIPLLVPLKEGNATYDRVTCSLVQIIFFFMIIWTFNRRIVIGTESIGTSSLFGAVQILSIADLTGAKMGRNRIIIKATKFIGRNHAILVDDQMRNSEAVVHELRTRLRPTA